MMGKVTTASLALRTQKVFLSRTTGGLRDVAEKTAGILRQRGFEVLIQTEFLPHWRDVKGMLLEKLIDCDCAICLIGPVFGMEMLDPVRGLKDGRTEGRSFSYTQLELLVARDLPRPVFTLFMEGQELVAPYPQEGPDLSQRQQDFIKEFAKDGGNTYGTFQAWEDLSDTINRIEIPRTVSAGRPCNLPYSTLGPLFKGRDSFLAALHSRLNGSDAAVIKGHAISGMGGVGKTRAAVEYAWRHAEEFRALLFATADTPQSLERSIAQLCGPIVLNLPEQDETDQAKQVAAAIRWLNRNSGWLLILDNADSEETLAAAEQFIARLGTGKCVITSRLTDYSGSVAALDLNVLDREDSADFLLERTAGHRLTAPDDREQALALADLLDGLALALEQAASFIRSTRGSFAEYIGHWKANTADALAWHDTRKMHYPRSLAITYQTSVAQLSPAAQEFFRVLAWCAPDPLPFFLLETAEAPPEARRLLVELENLSLARRREDGSSFSIHRLLQEITRQQQPSPPPPPALGTALVWINDAFPLHVDDVRTWPVAVLLAPHAEAVATSAAERSMAGNTARLLNNLGIFHYTGARNAVAAKCYRRALSILDRTVDKMHPDRGTTLSNLGCVLHNAGQDEEAEAMHREALATCDQTPGRESAGLTACLNNLASVLNTSGRAAEAELLYRRALAVDEAIYAANHPAVAMRLAFLGGFLAEKGRLREAEPMLRRALAIDESIDPLHPNVARDLRKLAVLLWDTNRSSEAEAAVRRSLEIDKAAFGENHPVLEAALREFALILLQSEGRAAEAEPLYRKVLEIREAAYGKDHPIVAAAANELGMSLWKQGKLEEAETLYRRALTIEQSDAKEPNYVTGVLMNNIGRLLLSTPRLAEAEDLLRKAFAILNAKLGAWHPITGKCLFNLGMLLEKTQRTVEAEPILRQCLEIRAKMSRDSGHEHRDLKESEVAYRRILAENGVSPGEIEARLKTMLSP